MLREIETAVKSATAAKKEVTLCGEAATQTELIKKFLNFGIDSFSVSPRSIPDMRKKISKYEQNN